jgi:hypothetical protein
MPKKYHSYYEPNGNHPSWSGRPMGKVIPIPQNFASYIYGLGVKLEPCCQQFSFKKILSKKKEVIEPMEGTMMSSNSCLLYP